MGNRIEIAEIQADVRIAGKNLGTQTIEIDYGAFRNERGRATTVMHWGKLRPAILASDLRGHFLSIERLQGTYRVSVTHRRPA